MIRRQALALIAGAAFAPARGLAETATVLSGERLRVGRRDARIADILAPFIEPGFTEPYAEAARTALEAALAAGVSESREVASPDRWGRAGLRIALHEEGKAVDLALRLIGLGAARVRPETDDLEYLAALLSAETDARASRRGLWGAPHFRVRDAADAGDAIGRFALVEGACLSASTRGGRLYLNFGADYRTDFTVSATTAIVRRAAGALDAERLVGARLRARGALRWINGPMIELDHPAALERLG